MVRSPHTQTLLLAALVALLVLSGTAFAFTFETQVTWQSRDKIDVAASDYAVHGGEDPTMTFDLVVSNPTETPVTVYGVEITVYQGGAPFENDEELSVARSARLDSRTTIQPGETSRVQVTVDLPESGVERARKAVANDTATASGIVKMKLVGKEFFVDV